MPLWQETILLLGLALVLALIIKSLFVQAFYNMSNAGNTFLLRTGQPVVDRSRMLVGQVQPERHVAAHRVVEEEGLLRHDGRRTRDTAAGHRAQVDVVAEERYWYPDDGGIVWVAGYQLVDADGRFLGRDAPEVRDWTWPAG